MKSLLLLTLVACAYGENQDLCKAGVASASGFTFVDDPSDCQSYLWCNFNASKVLQSVHQGKCDTGFNFNPDANSGAGACDSTKTCGALCSSNTAEITLRIAVPTDNTCRSFQSCNGKNLNSVIQNCTAPGVFNRNFGICTTPSIAPCGSNSGGGGGATPECENDGFKNDESGCERFFICENGSKNNATCPNQLHFNPTGNFCDRPENLDPLCTNPTFENIPLNFVIPKPPHINSQTFKHKISMKKLSMV